MKITIDLDSLAYAMDDLPDKCRIDLILRLITTHPDPQLFSKAIIKKIEKLEID